MKTGLRSSPSSTPDLQGAQTPAPRAATPAKALSPEVLRAATWSAADAQVRAAQNVDNLPRRHVLDGDMSALAGLAKPAVIGAMLAVVAGGAASAQGAPIDAALNVDVPPPGAGRVDASAPPIANPELVRALNTLDQKFAEQKINAEELAKARRMLFTSFDGGPAAELPRDHRGRIDVDALVTMVAVNAPDADRERTRGEIVMDRMTNEIERRMRLTARDMANPETRFLDGVPGYKEIPADDVQKIVTDALKDVPLAELPGGPALAELVKRLPNAGHLDALNMSFNELQARVGDANRDWLKAQIEPLIEGHEVEAGIGAFVAITGLRAASPAAAGLMDGLKPRATIWHDTFDEGRIDARVRAAYRDRNVLPDLDLEATARRELNPNTTLRASIGATASIEARDHLTGTATVGANYRNGNLSVDGSGTYYSNTERFGLNVSANHYDPDTKTSIGASLNGVFGEGVAQGDANGRVALEVDLAKDIKIGEAKGDLGLFGGVSADSDGRNAEARAGVMFRLRW
jgi:hypothetical protein